MSKQLSYVAVTVLLVGVGVAAYWYLADSNAGAQPIASNEVVTRFHTGLLALDAEDNERALAALSEAVQLEPDEPALWADLAIAQLRLSDSIAARQSLEHALQLAPDSLDLAVLNAEFLTHAGDAERAIVQLRQTHKRWPEDIAATYSLIVLLGQLQTKDADVERFQLLTDILLRNQTNLQALVEKARVAAALQDGASLLAVLDALQTDRYQWSDTVQAQLNKATEAAGNGDFQKADLAVTDFQKLLEPLPEYQQCLAELGVRPTANVGTPIRQFLRLADPEVETAQAGTAAP